MSDAAFEIGLLADEVTILVRHHRQLAVELAAAGNAAAAAKLEARAGELEWEAGLQARLGAAVTRLVRG